MQTTIYLQGLTMGLAYVAPIGMQNLFVINTALTQSRKRAVVTAGIVIFFDITLSLACFFGIGTLMQVFPWCKKLILLAGSIIIMGMGYGLLRDKTEAKQEMDMHLPWIKVITTACVVSWFNPQAVLDGTMLLGAFRATLPASGAMNFLFGVMSASTIWFLGLAGVLSCMHRKCNTKLLRGINLVCGSVMLFYGIRLLYQLWQAFQ